MSESARQHQILRLWDLLRTAGRNRVLTPLMAKEIRAIQSALNV